MFKQQLISGPSCLTAAEDDEPLFLLRANDELAAQLVLTWAEHYVAAKRRDNLFNDRVHAKFDDAVACAEAMLDWRRKKGLPT